MMKFMVMMMFMSMMVIKNKMLMFYYNLCFIMSFMMIFMYMFKMEGIWINVTLSLSVEYYSILLGILSMWIIGGMYMCLKEGSSDKLIVFLSMLVLMEVFFFSSNMLLFYLVFEISLIPTFFLIIYWGSNYERVSAAYYMVMYMLFISFPLLVYIFNIYMISFSFKFMLMKMLMEMYECSVWGYILIFLAFYIKMPVYFFHVWLPKAHVEAPVYGSMILAGILLKMGSYGLIRLMEIFIKMSLKYNFLVFSIAIIGSLYMSLVCLIQIDLKSLVAYSSVVHMNMMLCSLMIMFKSGFVGSYIMMVSHGLCSSGLFYMVNMYYERSSSRLLLLNKGMISKMPIMSMWWFILCVANFSFPFCLGFISEIMMLGVILSWEGMLVGFLMMICFLSSAYSLNLYAFIQHGSEGISSRFFSSMIQEYLIIIIHLYPLVLLLLNMLMFM